MMTVALQCGPGGTTCLLYSYFPVLGCCLLVLFYGAGHTLPVPACLAVNGWQQHAVGAGRLAAGAGAVASFLQAARNSPIAQQHTAVAAAAAAEAGAVTAIPVAWLLGAPRCKAGAAELLL